MKGFIKLLRVGAIGIALTVPCVTASSSELVFQFKNPSFVGGDSFNGSYLFSKAQSQNGHTKKRAPATERNELEEFTNSLNRQILFRLSRELINRTFGDSSVFDDDGSFDIGGFHIDVTSDLNGIDVTIIDIKTGNTTNIKLPYY